MAEPLRIGLVGLDTSHVVAFTRLLNDPAAPNHVAGGRVVAGFPGASADFELSFARVEGFTQQLRDEFGVEILDSPEAVADRVDLLFISSVDGRRHRPFFERTADRRRPTFIDKPFTTSLADAKAILQLARECGIPVMSCSSLRYADNLRAALARTEDGPILGVDVFGPMNIEPTQPGLFWYGIHCVEMLVATLGVGCQRVHATANAGTDLIVAEWSDGRMASLRGIRGGHDRFGISLHREKGFQFVDVKANARPYYAGMLEAILQSLPNGRSDVPGDQMLEVVRFIEAANASREAGRSVDVRP
jgi:predicted dehydrogenase